MTTTNTTTGKRMSNADLMAALEAQQAIAKQQAEQIALLLSMQDRAAESPAPAPARQTAPAPAPAARPKTAPAKTAPAVPDLSSVRWIDVRAGSKKPWVQNEAKRALSDRHCLIAANGRPLIDAPASIISRGAANASGGGYPLDPKWLANAAALAELTPAQLKASGLKITNGLYYFTPKG